ncbi:hypothetical protein ACNKF0_09285 [Nocardioides sp. T5]|uniref:hypothetical protein n=1 Tax=Nocardioides sp. T5 TaxID=3400182 RepID=UPI003A8671FF
MAGKDDKSAASGDDNSDDDSTGGLRLFENLAPRDFAKNWPSGRVRLPQEFLDRKPNASQMQNALMAVNLLRQLALDINEYLPAADKQTTQKTLAKSCMVSTKAVGNVRKGRAFVSLPTYLMLRTRVPTAAAMRNDDFKDQVESALERRRKQAEGQASG